MQVTPQDVYQFYFEVFIPIQIKFNKHSAALQRKCIPSAHFLLITHASSCFLNRYACFLHVIYKRETEDVVNKVSMLKIKFGCLKCN